MLLLVLLVSCDKFEFNPYEEINGTLPKDLNAKNIERLLSKESVADDTITIVFSGDSQRHYDNLEELVAAANAIPDVDFFVLAGDLSDFGLIQEFEWIDKKLEKLNMPFVCVIGNHDLIGNGLGIFRSMFGPENVSFHYKGYKFLLHDSNGREYGFNGRVPDMNWLASEVDDRSVNYFVGISHVPPYSVDFDPALENQYRSLMANKAGFRLSLHGHLHEFSDSYYYHDSVRYIGSNAVVHEQAVLLKLIDGKVIKKMMDY